MLSSNVHNMRSKKQKEYKKIIQIEKKNTNKKNYNNKYKCIEQHKS